jgi:hypothetical protein
MVKKVITAHQPNYLPWIGLFSKICQADCFILADTFALGKQSTFNRNKIRTNSGWGYLTIPIGNKMIGTRIDNITVPADNSWKNIHWQTIYRSYKHTDYFNYYQDFFEELYQKDFPYLWQINQEIILYLMKCFDIHTEVIKASEMAIDPDLPTTDYIIGLVREAGGDVYLSGPSGKEYLSLDRFSRQGTELKFFKLEHPVYRQRFPGFEPNLSAIDLLFNEGPRASRIIKESGRIEDQVMALSL